MKHQYRPPAGMRSNSFSISSRPSARVVRIRLLGAWLLDADARVRQDAPALDGNTAGRGEAGERVDTRGQRTGPGGEGGLDLEGGDRGDADLPRLGGRTPMV